ncbi:unnamed protein product, partial [Didymodactylos carnosus]
MQHLQQTNGNAASATQDLYDACKQNDVVTVQKYLQVMSADGITERVSNGSTALHVASYYSHNEIVKFSNSGASRTIRNMPFNLTAYEEARSHSTKDVFQRKNTNDNDNERFIGGDLHTEWTLVSREPFKRREYIRSQLRQFLSLLQTNPHNHVDHRFETIVPEIHLYIDTLPLTSGERDKVKGYFSKLAETRDPTYIVKAYSSTTHFYKYLNQNIA